MPVKNDASEEVSSLRLSYLEILGLYEDNIYMIGTQVQKKLFAIAKPSLNLISVED